ncbi:MAG: hypothetical protein V2I33_24095 [Kangiellaceae bacterium]|nr:hypothetical protein [Kangiellaceae bacterium]
MINEENRRAYQTRQNTAVIDKVKQDERDRVQIIQQIRKPTFSMR